MADPIAQDLQDLDEVISNAAEQLEEEERQRRNNAGRTPPPTLDERIAIARARHTELTKQRLLEQLNAEIEEMESGIIDGEPIPPTRIDRATPASSSAHDEYERPAAEIQPEKLSQYNGKNVREHRDWTRSAENAFRLAPRKFQDESTKIAWSAQFLRGTPATTWLNIAATGEADSYSWEAYKQMLLNLIEDPTNRQLDAAQAYEEARQRPNQSAQEFNQYLISLESQLDEEYTPEQRRTHLWTKLLESTKNSIMNYQDIPVTRDALVALATRIEKATTSHKRNLSTANQNQDKKRSKFRDDRSDRSSQPQRQGRSNDSKPNDRSSKSSTQDLAHITCYKCGKKGHYASKCLDNTPTVAALYENRGDTTSKKEGKVQRSNSNSQRGGPKTS